MSCSLTVSFHLCESSWPTIPASCTPPPHLQSPDTTSLGLGAHAHQLKSLPTTTTESFCLGRMPRPHHAGGQGRGTDGGGPPGKQGGEARWSPSSGFVSLRSVNHDRTPTSSFATVWRRHSRQGAAPFPSRAPKPTSDLPACCRYEIDFPFYALPLQGPRFFDIQRGFTEEEKEERRNGKWRRV